MTADNTPRPRDDSPHHVRIIVEGPHRECLEWDDCYSWAEARRLLRTFQDCNGKLTGARGVSR